MQKIILIIIVTALCLMGLGCTTTSQDATSLRVMTFNVRVNLPSDGDNAWPQRKDMAASMVRFYAPDLFGVQEALKGQVADLSERLPQYDWYGIGRDDGLEQGEYMAIFYDRSRFQVLHKGTFWLSETPEKLGLGWDADWIRTTTWIHFKEVGTEKAFYHFNTHFDNKGETARLESAKLLLNQIKVIAGDAGVIVTGDFNCGPDSEPYGILTSEDSPLRDTKSLSKTPHHGPTGTFTKFNLDTLKIVIPPIDFVFVTENFEVFKHATLSDSFDGYFPSDHFPVLVELNL